MNNFARQEVAKKSIKSKPIIASIITHKITYKLFLSSGQDNCYSRVLVKNDDCLKVSLIYLTATRYI